MSGTTLRAFTAQGTERFRAALEELRTGVRADLPDDLLQGAAHSRALEDAAIEIGWQSFASRLDLARYLHERLAALPRESVDRNRGLWAWLSVFYFDLVCPKRADGLRRPGRDYRHIPETGYRYQHRHLLFGAYQLYRRHGEACAPLLLSPPHTESALYHEIASRLDLIANRGVLEAVEALYFDRSNGAPKRKALDSTANAGTIRRLVQVLQQLDLTFDIYGMAGDQIIELLPSEFDGWRGGRATEARAHRPTPVPRER